MLQSSNEFSGFGSLFPWPQFGLQGPVGPCWPLKKATKSLKKWPSILLVGKENFVGGKLNRIAFWESSLRTCRDGWRNRWGIYGAPCTYWHMRWYSTTKLSYKKVQKSSFPTLNLIMQTPRLHYTVYVGGPTTRMNEKFCLGKRHHQNCCFLVA